VGKQIRENSREFAADNIQKESIIGKGERRLRRNIKKNIFRKLVDARERDFKSVFERIQISVIDFKIHLRYLRS